MCIGEEEGGGRTEERGERGGEGGGKKGGSNIMVLRGGVPGYVGSRGWVSRSVVDP